MNKRLYWLWLSAVLVLAVFLARATRVEAHTDAPATKAGVADRRVSTEAFEAMVPVLHHPRCMNCHMTGDYPRQGNNSHPHIMDVRRGPAGHGLNGVQCSTCHQDHNLAGINMPPGAPGWALPPPAMPMIWQNLNDHQLCVLLKDPHQNGYRTVSQIVEHMHTPLVLWGWHPGEGRTPIPYSETQFLHNVQVWAAHGAACPA